MTDEELAAIKARQLRDDFWRGTLSMQSPQMHDDRAALLAEVERLTADAAALREMLSEASRVLAKAHDRIHSLPRTSDTELAEIIGTQRSKISAALARAGGGAALESGR